MLAGINAIGIPIALSKKKYSNAAINLGSAAACVAYGAIYDNVRNKKAEKAANEISNLATKNALAQNDRLEISRKGNAYYNSNVGGKLGAIFGGLLGLTYGITTASVKEQWDNIVKRIAKGEEGFKISKPAWIATSIAVLALGGLAVGKIAEYFTNKEAYRNS